MAIIVVRWSPCHAAPWAGVLQCEIAASRNLVKLRKSLQAALCACAAPRAQSQERDLEIPRDALVVFTGVSGSGKSSLAFGTLYAEAQRRYLESVSPYARRLFHQMARARGR